ncbi:hypothetical protein Baya_0351 [Bagarius yarrelli]|uniref:Uncharacterized protein n=1 Tax=Bagarius yarrelli TaxID=175774 RepID=A0A556TI02_BAGYA|nr:hypothetical protein Baya_0351 [Bagarius yarrelli]
MAVPHQAKKQSPRRASIGRLVPHTRHARSGQTRHTPRAAQPRSVTPRKQATHTSQGHTHGHAHLHSHSHRSLSAQGGPNRPGNGHIHMHSYTHLSAHAEQGGCNLFCYLCYCAYCLGLMVLSFCLLLFLSPPSPRSHSHPASPQPSSTFPQPDDSFSMHLSSISSLAFPFCPHPALNFTSSNISTFFSFTPFLSSTGSLSNDFLFNLTSPLPPCPSTQFHTSPLSSSSSPDFQHGSSSSSSSSPSRPFMLVPPSLLLLPRPSLCHSRPSSSRSLPSLLLCPTSFTDPALLSLEHIPLASATPRPKTLLRQQSLQQPLIQPPASGLGAHSAISQSLGQLHPQPGGGGGGAGPGGGGGASSTAQRRGTGTRGTRGSTAGGGASRYRSGGTGSRVLRGNPGSWDYMMSQIKNRGLDVKTFL